MNEVCRYKFLVIDDADLLEINNLQRKVNQAIKHTEPVVKLDAPWDEKSDTFSYLNVLYDDQEQLFKCGTSRRPRPLTSTGRPG